MTQVHSGLLTEIAVGLCVVAVAGSVAWALATSYSRGKTEALGEQITRDLGHLEDRLDKRMGEMSQRFEKFDERLQGVEKQVSYIAGAQRGRRGHEGGA